MNHKNRLLIPLLMALLLLVAAVPSGAGVLVQCPGDSDGDAIINKADPNHPNAKCMHLSSGDGFATMADGTTRYIFGFAPLTGLKTKALPQKQAAIQAGILAHQWPAPTIELEEGQEFYLSLTNVGMAIRPDLFDPHTVHFHGFPQSSTVFDGLPESGIAINMGATLTYYYKLNDPGTYMYHCHVEATEHMQMGMLGNLYIKPAQDGTSYTYAVNGKTYAQFAYNDGDGSTGYDVAVPIQLGSFDSRFHDASESVQPLPFAAMKDNYPMINGRGYPDTVDPRTDTFPPADGSNAGPDNPIVPTSQPVSSLIFANPGDTILLRISNLAITRYYTLQSLGLPMRVVGKDAKELVAADGTGTTKLHYMTNSVTVGGGESYDVILDNVPAGTFFLYTSNLNYLSNDEETATGFEGMGGMMTEIQIN